MRGLFECECFPVVTHTYNNVQVQGETMGFKKRCGAQHRVCPHVPMSRVEIMSDVSNGIIPHGLLVRVWRKGSEPDLSNPLHYRSPVDRKHLPWLNFKCSCFQSPFMNHVDGTEYMFLAFNDCSLCQIHENPVLHMNMITHLHVISRSSLWLFPFLCMHVMHMIFDHEFKIGSKTHTTLMLKWWSTVLVMC